MDGGVESCIIDPEMLPPRRMELWQQNLLKGHLQVVIPIYSPVDSIMTPEEEGYSDLILP